MTDPSTLSPVAESFLQFALSVMHGLPAASKRPLKILESGCGTGTFANALAKQLGTSADILGIDPFPKAIATATESFSSTPGLKFKESDLLSLDTAAGTFDVIICVRSLHHVFPIDKAAEKLHTLLAPGGMLIAEEFAREKVSKAAAYFLLDRVDMFRAMGVMQDAAGHGGGSGGGGHSHDHGNSHDASGGSQASGHSHGGGHDHQAREGSAHSHGGGHAHEGGCSHEAAQERSHKGGHLHDGVHSHDGGHSHSQPAGHDHQSGVSETSNLSYVHGHKHVGQQSDGLPREGLPSMDPVERWHRMTKHDPPLPSSAEMTSALEAAFGKSAIKIETNRPMFHLLASYKVNVGGEKPEEERSRLERVVYDQEMRCIREGTFEGIGMIYTCTNT